MRILFSLWIALLFSSVSFANENQQNWPHWRGPQVNGYAPNSTPPIEWSENKNIKWKIELPGEGSATPIIWGNKMFVVAAKKTDRQAESINTASSGNGRFSRMTIPTPKHYYQFIVLCIDKNTGDIIWQDVATEEIPHESHHLTGSYAAGSPFTDGKHLYVTFGSYGFYCYDLDGSQKWKTDLGDLHSRRSFGEGASVVVHDDSLIVNWDNEIESYYYCLDATTGDVNWKVARDEKTTWSTPLITEYNGVTQVITNGTTRVRSYNIKNGDLIWECGGQTTNPIPCPVRYEDSVICMSGWHGGALYAIPLDAQGDITDTDKILWSRTDYITPYVPSPLLYDGQLYFLKNRDPILTSVYAKDGSTAINTTRLPVRGAVYASPLGADGRVYICTREGETVVFKHASTFEVLATNKLDEVFAASPVAVGSKLFLRGKKHLYCVEE